MRALLLAGIVAALGTASGAQAQEWRQVTLPDGPGTGTPLITDVTIDGGTLWLSTSFDGLMAFDGSTWVLHTTADGGLRSNAYHNTILVAGNGDKWTCKDGVQTVDRVDDGGTFTDKTDDVWTYYSQPAQFETPRVFSMVEDGNGNMWFGMRDENFDQPSTLELLIENDPSTTSDDDWLAYDRGDSSAPFFTKDVRALALDHQERLWIVYAQAGIDVWGFGDYHTYDDDTVVHYSDTLGLPSNAIHAVYVGTDGRVWVGADGGLAVLDPSTETWTDIDGIPGFRVNTIDGDAQGHIWIGTDEGAAMLYRSGEVVKTYTAFSGGLQDDDVNLIAVDQAGGTVWAVSVRGGTGETSLNVLESGFGPEPSVFVYPNPWEESEASEKNVKILGAPDGSTVEIFDITGQRVRKLDASREPFLWDSLDSNLNEVASGVYIVRIVTPSGEQFFTKAAIIR
ncbi:MAG: two-component regulator propeller domain-containing protein [Candidatus Eisenbacteria bacterium]